MTAADRPSPDAAPDPVPVPQPPGDEATRHLNWCGALFGHSCDCGAEPRPYMTPAECANAKANNDDLRAQEEAR